VGKCGKNGSSLHGSSNVKYESRLCIVLTQEAVGIEVVADDPGEEAGERGHVEDHEEEEGGEVEGGVDPVACKVFHLLSVK